MSQETVELMARLSITAGSMALVFVVFCLTEITRARRSEEYGELLSRLYLAARHIMGIMMGGVAVVALLANAALALYLVDQGSFPLDDIWLQLVLGMSFFFGLADLIVITVLLTLYEMVALPGRIRELEEEEYA